MQKFAYVLGIDLGDEQARAAWVHRAEMIDLGFGYGHALPYGVFAQKEEQEAAWSLGKTLTYKGLTGLAKLIAPITPTPESPDMEKALPGESLFISSKDLRLDGLIAPDPLQGADSAAFSKDRSMLVNILRTIISAYVQTVEREQVIMWGTPDPDEIGAVLALSPDFRLPALEELRKACDDVGFTALRLISRPVAALLGGVDKKPLEPDRRALLLLLDRNGFTQCLLQTEEALPYSRVVLCTTCPIGSRALDLPLHDWLVSLIEEDIGQSVAILERDYPDFRTKLRMASAGLLQHRKISHEELLPGYNLALSLTDEEIHSFCAAALTQLYNSTSEFVAQLKKLALTPDNIILVASSVYAEPLRQKLVPLFADWPEVEIWPPEVMAHGAAWLASQHES